MPEDLAKIEQIRKSQQEIISGLHKIAKDMPEGSSIYLDYQKYGCVRGHDNSGAYIRYKTPDTGSWWVETDATKLSNTSFRAGNLIEGWHNSFNELLTNKMQSMAEPMSFNLMDLSSCTQNYDARYYVSQETGELIPERVESAKQTITRLSGILKKNAEWNIQTFEREITQASNHTKNVLYNQNLRQNVE